LRRKLNETPPAIFVLLLLRTLFLASAFLFPSTPLSFFGLASLLLKYRRGNRENRYDITHLFFETALAVAPRCD
jgi:hypothetical protein